MPYVNTTGDPEEDVQIGKELEEMAQYFEESMRALNRIIQRSPTPTRNRFAANADALKAYSALSEARKHYGHTANTYKGLLKRFVGDLRRAIDQRRRGM